MYTYCDDCATFDESYQSLINNLKDEKYYFSEKDGDTTFTNKINIELCAYILDQCPGLYSKTKTEFEDELSNKLVIKAAYDGIEIVFGLEVKEDHYAITIPGLYKGNKGYSKLKQKENVLIKKFNGTSEETSIIWEVLFGLPCNLM